MTGAQSVIVCEGYHDRAFWKGWLTRRGCVKAPQDPWGSNVRGGQFGLRSPSGRFIRVVPVNGNEKLLYRAAGTYLRNAATEPTTRIIVSTDADDRSPADRHAQVIGGLERLVETLALTDAERVGGELRAGSTTLSPLVWPGEAIAPAAGVPSCATLEQVVCAVLARHEPARGPHVGAFLATAGDGTGWTRPADVGKSHAWAWMAHREPGDAGERFFEAPWEDDTLAAELEALLGARAKQLVGDLTG